jgi:hypothetical protein
MKKIILQTTAILLILAGVVACGKEEEDIPIVLDLGTYIETYPTKGRTRVDLIDREKLAIIKDEGRNIDEFYYTISDEDNVIDLTLIADPSLGGGSVNRFYIKTITSLKFEIENLYPGPYIGVMQTMIFEKENMLTD